MRRWNGWGDDSVEETLSEAARYFLQEVIGPAEAGPSTPFERLVEQIPASRIDEDPLLTMDSSQRLRHARGQSLPDWIDLRFGSVNTLPDAVAYPADEEEVKQILSLASNRDAVVKWTMIVTRTARLKISESISSAFHLPLIPDTSLRLGEHQLSYRAGRMLLEKLETEDLRHIGSVRGPKRLGEAPPGEYTEEEYDRRCRG